jgi:hypothetical protein
MERSNSERPNCETCLHYRPQVSFVDTWKRTDQSMPRKGIMDSLREVRKAETEALESEVELLFELVRGELLEWPHEPRFAPYCNHGNKVLVAALKNQAGRCEHHKLARSREESACHTCIFMTAPQMKIGDRHESIKGYMNQGLRDHVRQQNKDKEDSEAAAMGLEIEQSFYGDGLLPVVSFLHTCGAKRSGGKAYVVPFANLRSQCLDHSPCLPVPPVLMEPPKSYVDEVALTKTLDIIQGVAATPPDDLRAGVQLFVDWMEKSPGAETAADWVQRGFRRWAKESKFPPGALDMLPAPSGDKRLLPFIAGADAFEWGWFVNLSRHDAILAAKIAAQQVAEYMAGVVDPLDLIAAIEGYLRIIRLGIVSDETVEALKTFTRRVDTARVDLEHVIRTDLVAYYELTAGKLSYAVTNWLRMRPTGMGGVASILGDGTALSMSDRIQLKAEQARADGEALLARLAALGDPAARPLPAQCLEEVVQGNQRAVDLDAQEQKDLFKGVLASFGMQDDNEAAKQAMAKFLGLPVVDTSPTATAVERVFAPIRTVELPRRHLMAWLIFRRGTLPVTPSAAEFKKGKRLSRWTPTSVEQALLEPASKNLEGSFVAPDVDPFLARCRRRSTPVEEAV